MMIFSEIRSQVEKRVNEDYFRRNSSCCTYFFFYVVLEKIYEPFKLLLFGVRFPKRFYFIFIFLPPEFYSAK